MNYRLIATQVGELLKYETTIKEINRLGKAVFPFEPESFPSDSITSSRAQAIYDWILTLAKQAVPSEKRDALLLMFCKGLCSNDDLKSRAMQIISDAGMAANLLNKEEHECFMNREFHSEIAKHSKTLFIQGNYFHAVFEASKAYNSAVKEKAKSDKDGQPLMMESWSPSGVLKVTACQTETDRNVQDGIKFLSAGLMQAVRNPTAHEPAIAWPISRGECLDVLSFISFLFRQLDKAVYFK